MGAYQLGDLSQIAGAFDGRFLGPALLCYLRSQDGRIRVRRRAARHFRNEFLIRRIDDPDRFAAGAFDKLTIDEHPMRGRNCLRHI